jgi:hypothetical protein
MANGNSHNRRKFERAVQKQAAKNSWSKILDLLAAAVLALVPWGQGMIENNPCWSWALWAASLAAGLHFAWTLFGKNRLRTWTCLAIASGAVFCFFGYRSIEWRTRPQIVFFVPGVALNDGAQWTLHTFGRITKPIFHVSIHIEDQMTVRALQNEPDLNKRLAVARGMQVDKTIPEADPDPKSNDVAVDMVVWAPLSDEQEYSFSATYREGKTTYETQEVLKMHKRSYALRVTDYESQRVLIECKDAEFPESADFGKHLPPCFPHYPSVNHFALLRCLY